MAILKVARLGHPVLREKARDVAEKEIGSNDFQGLVDDMLNTMHEYEGVGLAGPQVHVASRVIVIADQEKRGLGNGFPETVLINPRIVESSKKASFDWEGCLSIPDLRGKVLRSESIEVEALDRTGKPIRLSVKGFPARVIQHECDHLDGVLFIDRMNDLKTLTYIQEYIRYWPSS